MWLRLFDALFGYHQLAVAFDSQEKLAFQGPNVIKWTHTAMRFGPMNGPATFISFIFDINSQWNHWPPPQGSLSATTLPRVLSLMTQPWG
jgi:hypothetical protein